MSVRIGVQLPTREMAITGDSSVPPLLEFAREAERLGFDSVWTGDSLTARPRLDPIVVLSAVSAVTGQGMDALRGQLDRLAFGTAPADDLSSPPSRTTLALNARHLHAIAEAREALSRAADVARAGVGGELVALELRDALDALGRAVPQEPLLGLETARHGLARYLLDPSHVLRVPQ